MEGKAFPIEEVHQYWFGECIEKPELLEGQARLWFAVDEANDFYIKQTFGYLFEPLLELRPAKLKSAQMALAAVLVLDQFSRNSFRSTPRAFEFDRQALAFMDVALENGWDAHLSPIERAFLLMPLQHSESIHRQKQSIRMFKELELLSQEPYREYLSGMNKFAVKHRDLIEQFGRFPHRNIILGRENTPDEARFLKETKERFGQASKP